LRSALAALDAYWAERDPSWAAGLRAGLGDQAISELENLIHPIRLSDEHRVLYGWHDGDGESHVFGPYWPWFISLAEAIEQWRFGYTELGWTPCWLPLRDDDEWSSERQIAVDKLRENYKGPILVRGQPIKDRISSTFARDWPSAWKEGAGIDEVAEVLVGPTSTIAELLRHEMVYGVIEGRVTWLGGGLESSIVQVDDGTGQVLVACPKGTPGARELGMELVMEITVRSREGPIGEDLVFVEGLMGHAPLVAESVRFVRSLRAEDIDRSHGR